MTTGIYVNYTLDFWGDGVTTVFTATLSQNPVLSAGGVLNKGGVELGTPIAAFPGSSGYTVSLTDHTLTVTFATAPATAAAAFVTVVYNG